MNNLDSAMVSKSHTKKKDRTSNRTNECEIAVCHNKKLHSYSIPKNEIIKKKFFLLHGRGGFLSY